MAKASDFYEANGLNQYKAINGATVDYDGNGNMVRDLKGRRFTYDAENVLQRVDPAGGGSIIAEYIYNPDGSRHYKRSHGLSGEQLHFYHVGDQKILETANNAGWTLQSNTVLRR
ncbi:MAG: hypothetical protein AAGH42_12180 [Pseudomonadota bacterium]